VSDDQIHILLLFLGVVVFVMVIVARSLGG
jgi:hypothetical protein